MTNKPSLFQKKEFAISAKDAARICDALEFVASCGKTEIYHQLKEWIDGKNGIFK